MNKKRTILFFCILFVSQFSFSAKLCGKISGGTKWQGGVFSVVAQDGKTIATTPYLGVGNQGCTSSFLPGTYIIRFNGALDNKINFDGVYGCTTAPYVFGDTTLDVVFNQGFPPFNGNSFCSPKSPEPSRC